MQAKPLVHRANLSDKQNKALFKLHCKSKKALYFFPKFAKC